jgi:hypothetical protein
MNTVTSPTTENTQASVTCRIHTKLATASTKVNITIWDTASNTYLDFPQTQRIHSWTTTLVSLHLFQITYILTYSDLTLCLGLEA